MKGFLNDVKCALKDKLKDEDLIYYIDKELISLDEKLNELNK